MPAKSAKSSQSCSQADFRTSTTGSSNSSISSVTGSSVSSSSVSSWLGSSSLTRDGTESSFSWSKLKFGSSTSSSRISEIIGADTYRCGVTGLRDLFGVLGDFGLPLVKLLVPLSPLSFGLPFMKTRLLVLPQLLILEASSSTTLGSCDVLPAIRRERKRSVLFFHCVFQRSIS